MFWLFLTVVLVLAVTHSGFRRFLLVCAGFSLLILSITMLTNSPAEKQPIQKVALSAAVATTGDPDADIVLVKMKCRQMAEHTIPFDPDLYLECP